MTHKEALDYELQSSPIAHWVGFCVLPRWVTTVLGNYFAWKVNRKMARYLRFKKLTTTTP